jgi:predicted NUDIX family NTP pyrophosphohydrolase
MAKKSAGILLWKRERGALRVLLVHPGGPFWKNKDAGAWSIPKGEYENGEHAEAAAMREFEEELGKLPPGRITPLGAVRQKSGKIVTGFALEGDFDAGKFRCNSFEIEWPAGSGKRASFPEIDRAEWLSLDAARARINPAQAELIDRLEAAQTTSSRSARPKSRPARC